ARAARPRDAHVHPPRAAEPVPRRRRGRLALPRRPPRRPHARRPRGAAAPAAARLPVRVGHPPARRHGGALVRLPRRGVRLALARHRPDLHRDAVVDRHVVPGRHKASPPGHRRPHARLQADAAVHPGQVLRGRRRQRGGDCEHGGLPPRATGPRRGGAKGPALCRRVCAGPGRGGGGSIVRKSQALRVILGGGGRPLPRSTRRRVRI
ncbi:hypothetical protein EMIHUDRAFT_422900, partial [Emiliania huxleyi CCMP1516]|uniref:Uncharacterized protein n=2 Tax=Emiliania huxleyi TaxID=2903 RepID=A0A0D3KYP4_EMIH1